MGFYSNVKFWLRQKSQFLRISTLAFTGVIAARTEGNCSPQILACPKNVLVVRKFVSKNSKHKIINP